jgi:hypothetical protein
MTKFNNPNKDTNLAKPEIYIFRIFARTAYRSTKIGRTVPRSNDCPIELLEQVYPGMAVILLAVCFYVGNVILK